MGKGGDGTSAAAAPVANGKHVVAEQDRAPTVKPPFTVGDLKRAIPAHCFKRSLFRSLFHLALDLVIVAALYFSTRYYDDPNYVSFFLPEPTKAYLTPVISAALWIAYAFVQGSFCTGIWVLAHECGHGAFSDYQVVNDTLGCILHSCLMVPYFSWKYSHRRHHSNTGSMERDEVFVPPKKAEASSSSLELNQHPFMRLVVIGFVLLAGWPLYLIFNTSGRKYDGAANHFHPYSPIFSGRERLWIAVSDLALLAVVAGLTFLGSSFGVLWVLKVYVAPLLVVNMFLVLITLLQHTHGSLPHYDDSEWEWLRGALCTVDRDYGVLNHVFHHIGDTHVLHHIFSGMPFYHAEEATAALKPILGDFYRFDSTPIPQALWREMGECGAVAPDAGGPPGIYWYTPQQSKKSQ